MKVLLCEDVDKLGWLGDIVEVKNGYARNYLLPCGIAMVPTEANIKVLANEKAKSVETRKLVLEKLEVVAKEVDGAEAVVVAKANEQGHLFGSVSAHDIAENLRQQGLEVSDDTVQLAEHIKEVGTHEVSLKFAAELTAKVSVVVVSEAGALDVADPADAEESVSDSGDQISESVDKESK